MGRLSKAHSRRGPTYYLALLEVKGYKRPAGTFSLAINVDDQATLDMIYEEVRKVNERLTRIEEVIEEVLIKGLPEAELSEEEVREIESSIKEMREGKYVTLEALKRA